MGSQSAELAEALLRQSETTEKRASETAWEIIALVSVGEGPIQREWDPAVLPPWAVTWEGRPDGNALPTALALEVASEPATHAAAMSPGARKALLEAFDERDEDVLWLGSPGDPASVDDLTKAMVASRWAHVVGEIPRTVGDYFRLSGLGKRVLALLQVR